MKIKLTQPISPKEIEAITHARARRIPQDARIEAIATHSDEVDKNTLFLALRGEKSNGEDFISQVIGRGGYALCEKGADGCFFVSSVWDALYALAKKHLESLTRLKHTVGITGSAGKTTTKEILRALTAPFFYTYANEGNQNSELGLPLTVLGAPKETECLILEMGMNHAGEIRRLSELCQPTLALITNIGHAHIGNLGDRTGIARAKREILYGLREGGYALIPKDEPLLSDIKDARTVSFHGEEADFRVLSDALGAYGLYEYEERAIRLSEAAQDLGMLHGAAFAAAAARLLGIKGEQIEKHLPDLSFNPFRQKTFSFKNTEILFDAYNASFEAVLFAIEALKRTKKRERALLLGDMLELGEHAESLHRKIGERIAKERDQIHYLFLFGKDCRFVLDEACRGGFARERVHYNPDASCPAKTAEALRALRGKDLFLTVKGARGMQMERITDILLKDDGGDRGVR